MVTTAKAGAGVPNAGADTSGTPAELVADAQGGLPLPWLAGPLADVLAHHRGHALLVHGAAGIGALPFALTLAQAWLCESDVTGARTGPCGHCASCQLVRVQPHPDLSVLLPETLRRRHGLPLADDKPDSASDKRKPSKQIRADDVRGMLDWATRTSGRGRGKVAVLHPAEAMNATAANALLKTLEEPPPGTQLVLTCADPALLLPTVRSRCQLLRLPLPPSDVATAWLAARGIAEPAVLLAACSGRPLDALELAAAGIDARSWTALPGAIARGHAGALAGWPVPRAVDALQKLCHDAMACNGGAAPRFFPAASVPVLAQTGSAVSDRASALADWSHELNRVARHDEHPWNEGLLIEALVQGGARALAATLRP